MTGQGRTAVFAIAVAICLAGANARGGQDPDAKSQQVFATACAKCHAVERIVSARRSRAQWEEVITTMITARGAQISDEDLDTILTYLSRNYGRVAINQAPAEDIAEALGLSDALAAAIVGHRGQHGPFADFDALLKVPGLDREKMEGKRDALTF